MKILIFLINSFFIINFSFAQDSSLFKQISINKLVISIATNPINFIWVYSPNYCTYTKEYSLFNNPKVIQFYSNNFTCYSIPIDSIKNLGDKKIKINKPGYYFIDSSFTIVHKNLRDQRSSNNLLKLGNIALDTLNRYNAIINRFSKGERNIEFLLKYLKVRKNAKEITTKDIDEFISNIDSSNIDQPSIFEFIYDYFFCKTYNSGYYYFNIRSIPFKILLNKRNLFVKKFDTIQIDLRINALLNFGLEELIQLKNLNLILKSAYFFNDTIPTYKLKDTDGNVLLYLKGCKNDTINKLQALKAFYYLETGDTNHYYYYEKRFLKLSKNNSTGLIFMAHYYFRNFNNNKIFIKKAENILKEAYKIDSNYYETAGLLAEITYNNGDYDEAIIYINKAINLYRENGISPSQYIKMKESIKKNKKNKIK